MVQVIDLTADSVSDSDSASASRFNQDLPSNTKAAIQAVFQDDDDQEEFDQAQEDINQWLASLPGAPTQDTLLAEAQALAAQEQTIHLPKNDSRYNSEYDFAKSVIAAASNLGFKARIHSITPGISVHLKCIDTKTCLWGGNSERLKGGKVGVDRVSWGFISDFGHDHHLGEQKVGKRKRVSTISPMKKGKGKEVQKSDSEDVGEVDHDPDEDGQTVSSGEVFQERTAKPASRSTSKRASSHPGQSQKPRQPTPRPTRITKSLYSRNQPPVQSTSAQVEVEAEEEEEEEEGHEVTPKAAGPSLIMTESNFKLLNAVDELRYPRKSSLWSSKEEFLKAANSAASRQYPGAVFKERYSNGSCFAWGCHGIRGRKNKCTLAWKVNATLVQGQEMFKVKKRETRHEEKCPVGGCIADEEEEPEGEQEVKEELVTRIVTRKSARALGKEKAVEFVEETDEEPCTKRRKLNPVSLPTPQPSSTSTSISNEPTQEIRQTSPFPPTLLSLSLRPITKYCPPFYPSTKSLAPTTKLLIEDPWEYQLAALLKELSPTTSLAKHAKAFVEIGIKDASDFGILLEMINEDGFPTTKDAQGKDIKDEVWNEIKVELIKAGLSQLETLIFVTRVRELALKLSVRESKRW